MSDRVPSPAEVFYDLATTTAVQVVEAIVGYRAQCEAAGFSPTAAEAMAIEYHALLIRLMLSGVK